MFEPIAIVGRACVLPGALTPDALWALVRDGVDALTDASEGAWGAPFADLECAPDADDTHDRSWSRRGGYVAGFESVFDPTGFGVSAEEIGRLDPLFQWVLHTCREALQAVRQPGHPARIDAILGNLSFPSASTTRYSESVWARDAWGEAGAVAAGVESPAHENRFMSGLPALLLRRALGLGGRTLCLDAACASSLYAIKLACDRLHDREADLVLAGAVNRADDVILHVGFCALNAMSRTGQSRPFHADADGLVPCQGAGVVALKRLADARRDGDTILGVIRGVGLSNDGKAGGLLAPDRDGQTRAMRAAYEGSGVRPADVGLLECHATGTQKGDGTELASSAEVFAGHAGLPIGSLKGNIGHGITTAGIAGLIKVLEAMRHGVRPATLHAVEAPHPGLDAGPFRLLTESEPWPSEGPRVAGVSAFGFGGNNAHLVVSEDVDLPAGPPSLTDAPIAVVGLSALCGPVRGRAAFAEAVRSGGSLVGPEGARAESITLDLVGLRFPPTDLQQSLAQQVAVLALARDIEADLGRALPGARVAAYVGMEADPEIGRYPARWRAAHRARVAGQGVAFAEAVGDAYIHPLEVAGVLGTMPNIPANRLNRQMDLQGGSFTVSAGEASGHIALEVALRALRRHEIDAAYVGASDFSCEPAHRAAAAALLPADRQVPGDGAVVLALMRVADAERADLPVLATLEGAPRGDEAMQLGLGPGHTSLVPQLGHAYAASGLLHLAAAIERLDADESASVAVQTHEGCASAIRVTAHPGRPAPRSMPEPARALTLPAHPPAVALPPLHPTMGKGNELSQRTTEPAPSPLPGAVAMPAAPALPSLLATWDLPGVPVDQRMFAPAEAPAAQVTAAPLAVGVGAIQSCPSGTTDPIAGGPVGAPAGSPAAVHQQFLADQAALHAQFMQLRQTANFALFEGLRRMGAAAGHAPVFAAASIGPPPVPRPGVPQPVVPPPAVPAMLESPTAVPATPMLPMPALPATAPEPSGAEPSAPAPSLPAPPRLSGPGRPLPRDVAKRTPPPTPVGPTLDRAGLEIHASGRVAEIFGDAFAPQAGYTRQTRMPEPPLLLADRMTGLDAEPASMGTGTIWTETDVRWDSEWLHHGRMPAGIMIESGQADLMLISYLGCDLLNRDERVYRLLGCELTYHGPLPRPGETLCYDIHVDGHATQGDIRMFFFHYDCRVDGELRLSVRSGQAGFFSEAELAESAGVLWSPEEMELAEPARLDAPAAQPVGDGRTGASLRFSADRVRAFAEGRPWDCFGPGFDAARAHVATPGIQTGKWLFLHEIAEMNHEGGPHGRGYLRAETPISKHDWYFDGHFKNDPCMPGTLMFEGCVQAMAFYLASLGYTIGRDGWRFEPVHDAPTPMRCRGQVTPTSKRLTYEVFVDEVIDGPVPTLWADLLCTVDGLKAFHARRVGLQLVPDWPMSRNQHVHELADPANAHRVADINGFALDHRSLVACAWGRPSEAFGPMYTPFDGPRRVARLPGAPYHFMTRVLRTAGESGAMELGSEVDVEYEVPADAWYFSANGAPTMPFAVLLEAALQPCGWLASFIGSALTTDEDLAFRNLDGTGTQVREVVPGGAPLVTAVKLTSISKTAGMIILGFDVKTRQGDDLIYDMTTVFGFFPPEALAKQVGLPVDDARRATLTVDAGEVIDLRTRPEPFFGPGAALAEPMLLMIDRLAFDAEGGSHGLGFLRSEKDVDVGEWFFKAHFYADPVQPGSLGIEAMLQVLQAYLVLTGAADGPDRHFEPIAIGEAMTWKYRGQVVPKNELIQVTVDVTETGEDARGAFVFADASLWVDGLRIYEASRIGMRVVNGGGRPAPGPDGWRTDADGDVLLDPAVDAWLADHCPTYTVPALPMMGAVDLLARAVSGPLSALREVRMHRWVVATGPIRLRPVVDGDRLQLLEVGEDGETEVVASARAVRLPAGPVPTPWPVIEGEQEALPYSDGRLFHGPAFEVMTTLQTSRHGATFTLHAEPGPVPVGRWHGRLLDGSTHGMPHAGLDAWFPGVGADRVSFPARIRRLEVFGPTPTSGEVRCVVRPGVVSAGGALFDFGVQLQTVDAGPDGSGGTVSVWAEMELLEATFPKGPLGLRAPEERVAFLRDRRFVDGMRLSRVEGDATVLDAATVRGSDWLPGTIAAVYGTNDLGEIARSEHLGARLGVHPSHARQAAPLNVFPVEVAVKEQSARVSDAGPEALDIAPVKPFWTGLFGGLRWPVEDLYYGLVERFVRRLVVHDPVGFEAIRGRSALYLANHQTMIESLMFSTVVGGLSEVPTLTLAKVEHQETWLGELIELCNAYPDAEPMRVITYFDRSDKASLPKIIGELGAEMAAGARSVMVHVEGTRSFGCRTPVEKMSGAFIDMALQVGVPIVPVRFTGGLPVEPLEARTDYPVGWGRQDIHVGAPLFPEALVDLHYGQRKQRVIDAINGIGPANADEQPLPGDAEFGAAVEAWSSERGVLPQHAALWCALSARADVSEPAARLIDAVRAGRPVEGDTALDAWLEALRTRLAGD